jgi:PhoPQ-activated pathogenicity-related protein
MLGTDPEGMSALMAIVDPINYISNLTMPKMIVDSTGDEFFMPGTP